jgi:hypothetical protein
MEGTGWAPHLRYRSSTTRANTTTTRQVRCERTFKEIWLARLTKKEPPRRTRPATREATEAYRRRRPTSPFLSLAAAGGGAGRRPAPASRMAAAGPLSRVFWPRLLFRAGDGRPVKTAVAAPPGWGWTDPAPACVDPVLSRPDLLAGGLPGVGAVVAAHGGAVRRPSRGRGLRSLRRGRAVVAGNGVARKSSVAGVWWRVGGQLAAAEATDGFRRVATCVAAPWWCDGVVAGGGAGCLRRLGGSVQ